MARTKTPEVPVDKKLALSLGEALALTPIGEDRLKGYINSGRLKAKRNEDEAGNAVGRYVILQEDLAAFLKSLPNA